MQDGTPDGESGPPGPEMDTVTVELEEATVEELDDIAFTDHRGNRAAAIRTLLREWLQDRE
jgi:metal-responsive CopG/Arc/MetJ family transcriptional regulator